MVQFLHNLHLQQIYIYYFRNFTKKYTNLDLLQILICNTINFYSN